MSVHQQSRAHTRTQVLVGVGYMVGPGTIFFPPLVHECTPSQHLRTYTLPLSKTHICAAIGGALFPPLGLQGMMRLLSLLPMFMAVALLTALGPRGIGRKRRCFPTPTHQHDTNTNGNGDGGTLGHDTLAGLSDGVRFLLRQNPWWADFTVLLAALALVGDAAALGFMDPTLALHLQQLLGLGVRRIGALRVYVYVCGGWVGRRRIDKKETGA